MFQGKCVDGKARYLQQSIFARLGLVLWICVGVGQCVAERNILVTLGCFLACPISQHRYMLESRLISPLLTDTHPKSPHHKTQHTILNQSSAIRLYPLPAVPSSQPSVVLVPFGSRSEFTQPLQTGKRRQ